MGNAGNVIQLMGTVATFFGLGQSLWIVTRMWDRFRNAFRRPQDVNIEIPAATATTKAHAPLVSATIPIHLEPTVEDALRRLALGIQDVQSDAWLRASELEAQIEALHSKLDRQRGLAEVVDERIGAALTSIDAAKRHQLARDLWIAVGGVLLTLLGQLLAFA
jgi:hypothetical protein